MARANYDLPEATLAKVKKYSGAKTKREALIIAMEDYLKKQKLRELLNMRGNLKLGWTQKSLRKYRG